MKEKKSAIARQVYGFYGGFMTMTTAPFVFTHTVLQALRDCDLDILLSLGLIDVAFIIP